jgi:hypothetical protein
MKYIIFVFLFAASSFLVAGEEVLIEDHALVAQLSKIHLKRYLSLSPKRWVSGMTHNKAINYVPTAPDARTSHRLLRR